MNTPKHQPGITGSDLKAPQSQRQSGLFSFSGGKPGSLRYLLTVLGGLFVLYVGYQTTIYTAVSMARGEELREAMDAAANPGLHALENGQVTLHGRATIENGGWRAVPPVPKTDEESALSDLHQEMRTKMYQDLGVKTSFVLKFRGDHLIVAGKNGYGFMPDEAKEMLAWLPKNLPGVPIVWNAALWPTEKPFEGLPERGTILVFPTEDEIPE